MDLNMLQKNTEPGVDRFDLEQQIQQCWSIIEDLKLLNESVLEKDLSTDWQVYDLDHEITKKGIERFVSDWNGLLK